MSFLGQFRAFIARGNVIDLAVGVIIGGAFSGIVSSVTDDLIMPVVGILLGSVDFSNYFLPLSDNVTASSLAEAKKQGAVLAYGQFVTVIVKFLILAFIIFLLVRLVNKIRLMDQQAPAPAPESRDVQLLTEIRDVLRAQAGPLPEAQAAPTTTPSIPAP